MLRFLSIKRLAIIDASEVEFDRGLNVLTGETGAGKSMLVEAVALILGGRASGDLVRTGEDTAVVQAVFEAEGSECIVRREITAQGRSRAFVDDTLITASALKAQAARMVELHGQHEHQTLLDPATHVDALDAAGGTESLVANVALAYAAWQRAERELISVQETATSRSDRLDLATFQLAELDRAALRSPDEDASLLASREILANAERLEQLCTESYALLYESDDAILARLGVVWKRVAELASLAPQFAPYLDARDGIRSQLDDLAVGLRRYREGIDASPERLAQVQDRLALIERLKKKHGTPLAGLIEKRDALRAEIGALSGSDGRLAALETARRDGANTYLETARRLSEARRQAAIGFSRGVGDLLSELAMRDACFEVRFQTGSDDPGTWTPKGVDRCEFYLAPNPGEDPRPLARIASGGELSRIMLALKTLLAASKFGVSSSDRVPSAAAPGLIFDEVDAGIGGQVAQVVGRHLRALGASFQVLCITHLPQIAALADAHFHVEKTVTAGRTVTRVRRLTDDERVAEVGRMLSGSVGAEGSRALAREMIDAGRTGPHGRTTAPGARRAKGESVSKGESERSAPGRTPRTR